MAGNNQFYPVATGSGANVLTPASWSASPVRQSGFQSGIAPSSGFNTAWRQSSVMASMIGSFIASAGYDALDNGDLTALLSNFQGAITNLAQSGAPASTSLIHSGADTSTTANQIALSTVVPDVSSLADYQVYEFVPANTNTGATTLTVKSFTGLPLLRRAGGQLASGDLIAGSPYLAVKLGSSFRLLSTVASELSTSIITSNVIVGGRVLFFKIVAGSYTWTCPANVTLVRIRAVAGGGGGGNGNNYAGAGGLGGNFFEGVFDVTPGTTYSIVVGAGGTSGSGNGGLTSFGVQGGSTLAVALGGTGGGPGGNSGTNFVGVTGASPGYSNISFPHGGFELLGYGAQNGIYYQVGSANIMQGGMGGGAPFFASATPYPVQNGSFIGTGCGGGASGGAGSSAGGVGAPGAIFIEG